MVSNRSITNIRKKTTAKFKITIPMQRMNGCLFVHKEMKRCTLQ